MDIADGAGFVRDALATIAVTLHRTVTAGDHTLALLQVECLHRNRTQRPLVFFDSTTHTPSR